MSDAPADSGATANALQDTRTAAKWLVGAFAAVGAVLLSGIGLTGLGKLAGLRFDEAAVAFAVGALGVIAAISLITDILTPAPITLSELADLEDKRNKNEKHHRNDELVRYVEADPSLLQGMIDPSKTDRKKSLWSANEKYTEALEDRTRTSEAYWDLANSKGADAPETKEAEDAAKVANSRVVTFHATVRRLEGIATGQQSVIKFQERRAPLGIIALFVAAAIGVFAWASNPPDPATADLRGADLSKVDLSGASLRGANLDGMTVKGSNLYGTDLKGASIDHTIWKNTICPNGTNSDNAGGTCAGHLEPAEPFTPTPLP